MQRGRVVGSVTAIVKHPSMTGRKLLVVQPQMADDSPDGHPLIAVDAVGAGIGERVMLTSDGRFGRALMNVEATPVRWTIIGIEDE